MTEAGSTTTPDWEVLTMSMATSVADLGEDSARTKFQCSISEEKEYPQTDSARWINQIIGSSSGDECAKSVPASCEPLPHSMPTDIHGSEYGEETGALEDTHPMVTSLDSEKVSSKMEGKAFADIFAKNSRAPKIQPCKSNSFKTVWKIAIAATAAVGIAMLVNTLQAEMHQNQRLQIELSVKDEKLDDLLQQIGRLKEVLTRHYTSRVSGV